MAKSGLAEGTRLSGSGRAHGSHQLFTADGHLRDQFYGYGFGQFGKVGATTATLIALAIFLFQIVMSALWLKFFSNGPMEWIWRQLTYRQRLDLRLKRHQTA
jgi:hypothetical protein